MEQSGEASCMDCPNTSKPADPQQVENPDGICIAEEQSLVSINTEETCANETKYCDLCLFDNIEECAIGFCINCTDFLCKSCLANHKRNKVTRSHNVLQGEEMPDNFEPFRALRALVKCEFHPEYDITYMCAEHFIDVCAICVTDKHRLCKLEKVSALINEEKGGLVKEKLMKLELHIEQLTLNQETYMTHMQEDQKRAISEAQDIAQQLIEHIVTLTNKVVDEITEIGNTEISLTKARSNDANYMSQEIRRMQQLMETATKYGSAEECILASRNIDANVKEILTKLCALEISDHKYFSIDILNEIHKLDRLCNVSFASGVQNKLVIEHASDGFRDVLECDILDEQSDNCTVRDVGTQYETSISKCNKEVQTFTIACASASDVLQATRPLTHHSMPSQVASKRSVRPFMERSVSKTSSKFEIKSLNDDFKCSVTAIKIMPDGKMFLADRRNRKIKLLSPEFVVLDECTLSGHPIDLCVVEDDIYVCCVDEKKIFKFSFNGLGQLCQTGGYPTKFWPVSISRFEERVMILFLAMSGRFDSNNHDDVEIEIRNGSKIDAGLEYGPDDPRASEDEADDHYFIDWAKRILTLENGSVVLAEDNRVSCYGIDECQKEIGDRKWFYKCNRSNRLVNARGLANDSEGNVYICGSVSNNIHQVSSKNYRHNRIIISDIKKPYSVCVDSKRDRLIVGCCRDNNIYVFDFL
ncbi:uncharacterized protein LOC127835028 [Dreissena polymorpha]|uniref:B box-type domain-containing protein n=1 Tax=Dreissena polymorpha TaxID=45954 RepID=A0A9D4JD20_DREPO|nr:uncharacterized protein LOC127835028 [Dreissena polymorpha]KAH3807230.1 hypothetical protein DPMN_135565 [Dreissena polymorpha]